MSVYLLKWGRRVKQSILSFPSEIIKEFKDTAEKEISVFLVKWKYKFRRGRKSSIIVLANSPDEVKNYIRELFTTSKELTIRNIIDFNDIEVVKISFPFKLTKNEKDLITLMELLKREGEKTYREINEELGFSTKHVRTLIKEYSRTLVNCDDCFDEYLFYKKHRKHEEMKIGITSVGKEKLNFLRSILEI